MNLNWRDASKELPSSVCEECVVVDEGDYVFPAYYSHISKCWETHTEYFGVNLNAIKYWLPLNEIPFPKE